MRILIAVSGTGGHLYPGLAVGRALREKGHEAVFALKPQDSGLRVVEKEGFRAVEITAGGMPRALSPQILVFFWKLLRGFRDSWRVLRRERPSAVLGMGGYLSVPVVLTAWAQGIPRILHEQNVVPGLANRFLSLFATSVAVSFPASLKKFSGRGVWLSGNPVRKEMGRMERGAAVARFGLDASRKTVLIFGGSQGAAAMNGAFLGALENLSDLRDQIQVIHVSGKKDEERVRQFYSAHPEWKAWSGYYCDAMEAAYAAADLVISRSGATTISELIVVKKPAILIPFPHAPSDHQTANAKVLADLGAAVIESQAALTPLALTHLIRSFLIEKPELLPKMSAAYDHPMFKLELRDAASRLAERTALL